ncbi:Jasmonate O-methyltransferase [Hordeum vulgare]|nr:Jasmonate O-methyltransferase [Hordeum vulgare]
MDRALLTPSKMVNSLRAAFELTIAQRFGSSGEIMDEFVRTGEKHLSPVCRLHCRTAVWLGSGPEEVLEIVERDVD